MSAAITDRTRRNLSQSLPFVELHKEDLVDRMEASLRAGEPGDGLDGQSEVMAVILVDLLLAQGRSVVGTGELGDLRDVAAEHRGLAISGCQYSRFGDALVPIVKDLLGPNAPAEVASAWCDIFWSVIRAVRDRADRKEMAQA